VIRIAAAEDAVVLCDLERAAMTAGLGHVFGDLPFPDTDVLARWALVLADPAATVLIDETVLLDEEVGEPVGYAAVVGAWLQHLGVVPAHWGTGRVESLYRAAIDLLRRTGANEYHLWVLEENHRARAFYTRRGWIDTDIRESEEFEPYPIKMQMTLHVDGSDVRILS
jgi:GNAT superfamily N-acetyltransferase